MHTISIFVDKNRMPKPASYFECQPHLAKNLIFGRGKISKKGIEKVLPVVTDNTIHKERFREPTHCMH